MPPAARLIVLGLLFALLGAAPAAAEDSGSPDASTCQRAWFGPALDIETDTPSAYADRLGATPSLYTFPVDYPLTAEGVEQLRPFAADAATQGAVLVVQVEPTVPLGDLTTSDADELAAVLADLHKRLDTQVLVRFAPEMNGSWRPWGQQPRAFTAAFRQVADVIHADAPPAAMVWSPVYGSGYPFGREQGTDSEIDLSGSREVAPLDTDGDGRLGPGDDPYAPYYPGDDAVDWVGLFLYRFGQSQGVRRNVVPPPGEVADRLAERWGYGEGAAAPFYDRFAEGRAKPLLLETAALYNPAVGGAHERALKRRWWSEVLDAVATHPRLCAISWLELDRVEPEVADQPVDWAATRTPQLAARLLHDLRAGPVALGPVTERHDAEAAPVAAGTPPAAGALAIERPPAAVLLPDVAPSGTDRTGERAAAVALVVLLALALVGARRRSWTFEPRGVRDGRLDWLRGLLLVGVVAWHLPVPGPLHDLAARAGALGGLETFVLVSGVAVGLTYPPLAEQLGHVAASGRRWRRALITWFGALVGVLGVYVLGLLPGLDLEAVGRLGAPGGAGAASYDLYAQARHLFDYPPPGSVGQAFLFLEMGTWLLLPLALFVALVALSPLVVGPLQRGWWWAVLPASWAVYALGRATGAELLPSLSEEVAPLLVWQVLFVHGVALGLHRQDVAAFLRRRSGAVLAGLAVLAAAGLLWAGVAPSGADPELPLDRLLVVAAATLTVVVALTTCWRPASLAGPALLPLGRAPLLVVLAHAVLVLVVASVSSLAAGPWVGTAATLACLAVLVVLARWRDPERVPRASRPAPSAAAPPASRAR
ncbi:OpgC domain-containing protein [Nocardioides sp.]|uniref:OpgC domain-containing protein n=1 Tax=Nocardioides sp. TaxID=35761 RepID=UPI0025CE2E6F|nr:OpgC domain-containing protein [Nocardioides sp.]